MNASDLMQERTQPWWMQPPRTARAEPIASAEEATDAWMRGDMDRLSPLTHHANDDVPDLLAHHGAADLVRLPARRILIRALTQRQATSGNVGAWLTLGT